MLSDELRTKLSLMMKDNPRAALKEIEQNPKILEILLMNDNEVQKERNEKIKYINMTQSMQLQLQQEADRLKTTQGLLIGAGILLLLSWLEKNR